jgi:hypothetical protein
MFRKAIFLSMMGILVSACTSRLNIVGDPKQTLTEYIGRTFAVRSESDQDILLSYLTGDVKARLQSWSKDQFRDAFIESKREFLKMMIREMKSISDHEVEITYELRYNELGSKLAGHVNPATITSKKLCQLVLVNGKWMISDVRNIRELLEFKDELAIP